ncbi:hypothetical protein THAR02_10941 [Trichoderma harzianum]|uniref:Heterokaryon incompatibility domain-containing protein n=1 Tax=Trichoderma harzianum TaxID=5544 RepID=A0A0F9ZV05_TRIHA|nr:hypothetical protein THAR02_10941 [Trichoderma harzianum]
MSETPLSESEVSWEQVEQAATKCPLDEYVESCDDNYYDDAKPTVTEDEDDIDATQEYMSGSYPYDPERDDPLRNKDVPEEQIAKGVVDAFLKMPDAARLLPLEKARIITTKILRVSDVVFSEVLPDHTERMIQAQILNHGLGATISKQITNGIAHFSFVKAVALLHHVCIHPASFDIPAKYTMCVRAVNALSHILINPSIKQQGADLVDVLEKTWDISVLFLGATRTRAQLVGDNYLRVEDINFLHAEHYRREVQRAMESTLNEGRICRKRLAHLTREEMPPFIRPRELLDMIKDMDSGKGYHLECKPDFCKPDIDGQQSPKYHAPGCSGSCEMIAPAKESIPLFDSILSSQRRMPAVRAYSYLEKRRWWVPVTRKTVAVSHLWRDGISGTRDGGMNQCLHHLFSQLAQDRGLDSYWIDCATIPEHPRQRRMMIQQINSTFHIAGFTLCMDVRIAKMKLPGTHQEGSEMTRHYDEKFLLAIITSFWHQRAWTLLEGHKSSEIVFFRESGQHFNLKEALSRVLVDEQTKTPLWIRACLAEFEAYMTDGLTPEAAGTLLATREASREGDAELIWRLLTQPYTTRIASDALNSSPWHFSDTADLAFICSNAERSTLPGLCWMPSQTKATAWARKAYGGYRADIVRTTNVYLRGKWYAKHGKSVDIKDIDFESGISHAASAQHLKWKLESKMFEFLFAQPVFLGDQGRPKACDRVIVLTRPCHSHHSFGQNLLEPLWHWETMVKLQDKRQFKSEDVMTLHVGFDHQAHQAPQRTPIMQPLQSRHACLRRQWFRANWLLHEFGFSMTLIFLLTLFVPVAAAVRDAGTDNSGTLSLSYVRLLPPQNVPKFIYEWAALIPLTVYLANGRSDYELAGEVSLRGRLSVSFIPKLWALGGLANLLRLGEAFFDSANNEGEVLKVFDVQHGSVFRCYNSAAASLVAKTAFGRHNVRSDISESDLIEWIRKNRDDLERDFRVARFGGLPGSKFEEICENRKQYGRRQVLNIIHVIRKQPPGQKSAKRSVRGIFLPENWKGTVAVYVEIILATALTALLYIVGCIGSGSLVFIGGISRFCAHNTVIPRPRQYLWNREKYDKGLMLVAVHENAAVWTLYHGDRGLIDSLLNKPMIGHLRPTQFRRFVYTWFRCAEVLQVIAMTFVAGQKGWDSLMLLILIIAVGGFSKLYRYNMHARNWLHREGFEMVPFQCEFSGRTELMAAVQTLSTEKRPLWMDSIIAPVARREVLLQRLGEVDCDEEMGQQSFDALGETDKVWVMSNFVQAKAACTLIEKSLKEIAIPKSV